MRLLSSGARLLLTRGRAPLATAQVRRVPEAGAAPEPLLPPDEKWFDTPALPGGDETALQEVLLAGNGRGVDGPAAPLSLLVQARCTPAGARVLISPRRLGPASAEGAAWSWSAPSPNGEVLPEIPLELAVELYPDAAGVWPELTEVGELGVRCTALGDRDPPRPDGKPFRALRLSFAGHNGPHVEIARSAPATWTLTKMPKTLLLRQRLLPDPRAPREAGAFVFYLGGELDARPPELSPLLLSKRLTPAGDFVEGAVRVYGGGADPYAYGELSVVAEFALPANGATPARILQAPCFFREGPTWAPAEGEWRFRFAPPGEGTYGVRVAAELRGRVTRGEKAVAFVAGPAADRGFVRVRAGERFLRFDDGNVFVPVGLSLPWPEKKGDADWFRRMFANLARQGGDATRVWLCSWGLPLEQPRAGRFDPDTAAALDEVLVAAQARGLYVILVAENAYDVARLSKEHPYFRELGGPLSAVPEFFRDPEALRLFRRRLTYLAARYGAYRAVLAWELLNEADQAWDILRQDPDDPRLPAADADRARAARRDVLNWAVQGAQHLQALDIHAHPVTFSMSLWPGEVWNELDHAPGLDILQPHGYVPHAKDAGDEVLLDEAALIALWAANSREAGRAHRPYWLTEFGYRAPDDSDLKKAGPEGLAAERNERDTEGLLLHNSLWAGLAAGTAGAPLHWWWDRYVIRHNLWSQYKGAALFARALGALYTREGPNTVRQLSQEPEKEPGVRVLGRVGRRGQCVWVQDRRSTWAASMERHEPAPPEIRDLVLRLPALEPGTYAVRWLDTWRGEECGRVELTVAAPPGEQPQPLALRAPPFRRDIAVVIERVGY